MQDVMKPLRKIKRLITITYHKINIVEGYVVLKTIECQSIMYTWRFKGGRHLYVSGERRAEIV